MNSFILRSERTQDVPVQDWMVLGRDPECIFTIDDPTVEPRHARLEARGDRWVLRDLRSPGGTWLNGSQIAEAFLTPGDCVKLGATEIYFLSTEPVRKEFPLRSRNFEWNATLQSLSGVSQTTFPVLLLGPSGTGKDVLARTLHEQSPRAQGPFVSVNCGALTETLVESELFGHVKGSFTGAINDRKGAFEAARGGTLFLDEIGDLPFSLQAKLLRALENDEIRPVGSDRNIKTDVRVIAATHQNLHQRIEEGSFRADLYYRLNVVTIQLPSLRERIEDFEDILYGFCKSMRVRMSVAAIHKLRHHEWSGNIRELKNFVARASALHPGESIEIEHVDRLLLNRVHTGALDAGLMPNSETQSMPVIKEMEKQMILKRLRANRGNQRRTANDLGLPKSTLHDRLRFYGINPRQFRA